MILSHRILWPCTVPSMQTCSLYLTGLKQNVNLSYISVFVRKRQSCRIIRLLVNDSIEDGPLTTI